MNSDKTPTTPFLIFAEQSSKVLALLAATLLIVSVCYDYAYLFAVGLSFNELPSLTTEHVRSALLWGPYVALVVTGAALQQLLLSRLEGGQSEGEIQSKLSQREKWFRNSTPKMALIVLSLATISTFLTSPDYTWMFLAFIVFWTALSASVIKHDRMRERFNRIGAATFGVLPILIALVAWQGSTQGSKLIAGEVPNWELTIRVGTNTNKQSVIGLRRFSTFAIIVDDHHFVSIIPNDAILSARLLQKMHAGPNNLCRLFKVRCPFRLPKEAADSKNQGI